LPSAVPTAPTSAEAPPPPGTGALEARTSTNSVHVLVENPIFSPPRKNIFKMDILIFFSSFLIIIFLG
jgi:hypothetical protein